VCTAYGRTLYRAEYCPAQPPEQLPCVVGNAVRYIELRKHIKDIAAKEASDEAVSVIEGDSIKFSNVMVN
jgi:hypothetical protein